MSDVNNTPSTSGDESLSEHSDTLLSDAAAGSVKDKHSYRVLMYNKLDVEQVEKDAIKEVILKHRVTGDAYVDLHAVNLTDTIVSRASLYFPEYFSETYLKKKKRAKKSSIYFIEDVAKYLWTKWSTIEDRKKIISRRKCFITLTILYSTPLGP